MLFDLSIRCLDLAAHYTDAGILPRSSLIARALNPQIWSIHFAGGTLGVQALLMALGFFLAILFTLGYKTRLVNICLWLFMISLNSRNPMILSAGDVLLRLLLMWCIFLPLNLHCSIDRGLAKNEKFPTNQYISFGTFALMMQIVFCLPIHRNLKISS